MKNKAIYIGVAGLGFGAQVHVPAFQSLPGVSVVALLGRDRKKTEMCTKQYGVPGAFISFEEFFSQNLDAVSLALPPLENEKAVAFALKKGIPVLSEKPLAGSVKSAKALAQAARRILHMVDFQFIELLPFQKLKKIIQVETFGKVRHGQLVWLVESWSQKNKIWSWKTDAKRGGGALALLGSHFFYLAEWLFGKIQIRFSRMNHKQTALFCPHGGSPADELVNLELTLPGNLPFSAIIGNASPGGIGHRWEIVFDKATVILHNPTSDYMSGFQLSVKTGKTEKMLWQDSASNQKDGRYKPFLSIAKRFISSLREKKAASPNFHEAARVQELMEQAYYKTL